MELMKKLTEDQHLQLSHHLEAARKIINEASGVPCDLVSVAHKTHEDGAVCEGVAVLTEITAYATFCMLAQATQAMEGKAREEFILRHVSANERPC
jgi:hypothetical protein